MLRANLTNWTIGLAVVAGIAGFGTNSVHAAAPLISGFGGDGTGWKITGDSITSSAFPQPNILQLTDNKGSESRNAFYATQVPVVSGSNGFSASFTYTASGERGPMAWPSFFSRTPKGPERLGGAGGGLGYVGISPSVGFEINLYDPGDVGNGVVIERGVNWAANDGGKYEKLAHVDLASGNPIDVTLSYSPANTTLTVTLTDKKAGTTDTFKSNSLDVATILGGTSAYVGFTGATGGLVSTQQISNFSYSVEGAPAK